MQNGRSPTHLRPPGAANCNQVCKVEKVKFVDQLFQFITIFTLDRLLCEVPMVYRLLS